MPITDLVRTPAQNPYQSRLVELLDGMRQQQPLSLMDIASMGFRASREGTSLGEQIDNRNAIQADQQQQEFSNTLAMAQQMADQGDPNATGVLDSFKYFTDGMDANQRATAWAALEALPYDVNASNAYSAISQVLRDNNLGAAPAETPVQWTVENGGTVETWGYEADGKTPKLIATSPKYKPDAPAGPTTPSLQNFTNPETGATITIDTNDAAAVQQVTSQGFVMAGTADMPGGGGGGPFEGTAMDAQLMNYLLDPNHDPGSAEYLAAYNSLAAPRVSFDPLTGQTVTINPDMSAYRAPSGGTTVTQSGDSGGISVDQVTAPRYTPDQFTVATFAERIHDANQIISNLEQAALSQADASLSGVPVVGNYLIPAEYQQVLQAQQDFINALLRRESGSAISDAEFANARAQYFPQPGDSPEVLAQKKANRDTVMRGLARASGGAYTLPTESSAPLPDGVPAGAVRIGTTPEGKGVWAVPGSSEAYVED